MNERVNEPLVVYAGGAVKSLGRDRIAGRVITFSSHADPDLVGEYFDHMTDFWMTGQGDRKPILYRHAIDSKLKRRRFGEALLSRAADGVWCEGQITGRDSDSRRLLELAEAGQLNWSTGATGHLVETTPVGKAQHIDSWPVAELSLCPHDSVCEPRNILTLKSFANYDTPEFDELFIPGQRDYEAEALRLRVELAVMNFERIIAMPL
jgi:hypothetical protein